MPCFLAYCSRESKEAAIFSRRNCRFLQESTYGMDTLLLPSSSSPSCSSSCFLIILSLFQQTNSCHRNLRICTYSKTKEVAIKISSKNSYYQKKKIKMCFKRSERLDPGWDRFWSYSDKQKLRSCPQCHKELLSHSLLLSPARKEFQLLWIVSGFWPHDRGKESLFFSLCQSGAIRKKLEWLISLRAGHGSSCISINNLTLISSLTAGVSSVALSVDLPHSGLCGAYLIKQNLSLTVVVFPS